MRFVFSKLAGGILAAICLSIAAASACADESIGSTSAPVSVAAVSFELDIQPILVASGCSAGACHGKSRGQNGFQLSLLCFDPDIDYAAITRNARGRRVFPGAAEKSLILQKATGILPHGGGVRLPLSGPEYQMLRNWIAQGAPRRRDGESKLTGVALSLSACTLQPKQSQKLTVTATYSDGVTREVTAQTTFQSSESAIVAVSRDGVITAGPLPGEATIMARYMSTIATCNVAIP